MYSMWMCWKYSCKILFCVMICQSLHIYIYVLYVLVCILSYIGGNFGNTEHKIKFWSFVITRYFNELITEKKMKKIHGGMLNWPADRPTNRIKQIRWKCWFYITTANWKHFIVILSSCSDFRNIFTNTTNTRHWFLNLLFHQISFRLKWSGTVSNDTNNLIHSHL